MAKVDEKVLKLVEEGVKANPKVTARELYEKAKAVASAIGELSVRQFNAIYLLPVKRRLGKGAPAKAPARKAPAKKAAARRPARRTRARREAPPAADRDAIRAVLLDFAKRVAGAEGKGQMVDLIAGIDRWVDRVAKAAGAR